MPTATATTAAVIDPSSPHLVRWAKAIARGIRGAIRHALPNGTDEGHARRCSRFDRGSDEEQDLEQVALTEMVSVAVGVYEHGPDKGRPRFDPTRMPAGGDLLGYFKGLAHPSIKWAVLKAARKLSNGGVGRELVAVDHLSTFETPTGRDEDTVELVDPRTTGRPDASPPAPPDPGRLDRVGPDDVPALRTAPAGTPVGLPALDAYLCVLSAELQAPTPPGVPATHTAAYARAVRSEMQAAEEARGLCERLLVIAGRYADLGSAVAAVLAGQRNGEG